MVLWFKQKNMYLQLRLHSDHEARAHPEPRVPALLAVLVVRAARPHAGVGQLRAPDDQHLLGHRDADAVGHGAEAAVVVAEPAGKIKNFNCFFFFFG